MVEYKGSRAALEKRLAEETSCYIVVTCSHPGPNGKMEVEMTYQGDPVLAAYLLEGAQKILEEDETNELSPELLPQCRE